MSKDNLIPQAHKLTGEEQSRGGKVSGEVRRNKRAIKEALAYAMSLGLTEAEQERLEAMGVKPEDSTQITLIAIGIINKAKEGDLKAVEYLRNLFTVKAFDIDFGDTEEEF